MTFEVGERVTFRSLQWEVESVGGTFATLFGRDRGNHGHRARVVLGLEPMERTEVPTLRWTLGEPRWNALEWRALHAAYRLTLSHGRGNLASADWGRLILEPYQLVPLQRIEHLPFPRLLIADDTGLGKTAEAGLILFRLLQKRRADRVLILCRARPEPERWRDELREKFGIDVTVINDGEDYARLRRDIPSHLNVFGHLSRVVMSMYFAAPNRRSSHIADDLAKVRWDVVIVDEAHHLAQSGDHNKRLAELGRIAADTSEGLLLLTATPHDGKAESFASLLRLLDPYVVVDPDKLDPAVVRPLLVRRLKPRVVKSDGTHFLRREVRPLKVDGTRAENWLDRGLRGYCRQLRLRASALRQAGQRTHAMGATFLEVFLRKRLASSAYACRESLRRRLDLLEGQLAPPDVPDSTEDRDEGPVYAEQIELPSGKSELEVLRDLVARAERIPEGHEAKVQALVQLVARILTQPSEKILVFTEFVDTLEMLAHVFEGQGWTEATLDDEGAAGRSAINQFMRYHGETPSRHREQIRKRFLEDPWVRILLATDAASESINLQKGCNNLIHLEAVWNPNRYEQRNGRIDRYGQTRHPQIYLLINTHSIDERVATVGYQKLERIAEDLGSVSNVLPLAAQINMDDFLEHFGEDQVAEAESEMEHRLDAAAAAVREEQEAEGTSDLIRGESFEEDDLRAVETALAASREFVPEFKDVEEFLAVYLRTEEATLEPVTGEPGVRAVTVPAPLRAEVGIDRIRRATFRRDLAVREEAEPDADRIEFLTPGHPLVRAALRRARGWVYRTAFPSRVSYRRVAGPSPPGFMFTYATRFLDGRGEAIEERFQAVFVGLDGSVSSDAEGDLRSFLDIGIGGNATNAEAQALRTLYADAFEEARVRADAEARRRAAARSEELARAQRLIIDEALIRLGRWQQASEERLRHKVEAMEPVPAGPRQLDLAGEAAREIARLERERERRRRLFRTEQQRLLEDEQRRREEIRSMEQVRLDSLDAIGALAIVPEGRW